MKKDELQSFDCKNLIKKESRTSKRYHREHGYIIGKQIDLSRSTFDRYKFVQKYGSKELLDLIKSEKISIWKAYKFVRGQQLRKLLKV